MCLYGKRKTSGKQQKDLGMKEDLGRRNLTGKEGGEKIRRKGGWEGRHEEGE